MSEPPPMELPAEVSAALARLDDLVEKFEMHPDPTVRDRVFALLNAIDVIHRAGLRAFMAELFGAGVGEHALDHPSIRLLVDLYDLQTGHARVNAVVEAVRDHVQEHGGLMEIMELGKDLVHIQVSSLGHMCEGLDLRDVVEREIRTQMPDVARVVIDNADPPVSPHNFVPLTSLRLRTRPTLIWRDALAAEEVPPGTARGVLSAGELSVLVANVDGQYVAYQNRCPGSALPLHGGSIEGTTLICPWHRCRFDLREGHRLDERRSAGNLERIAVMVDNGELRIGIPEGRSA